MQYRPRIIHAWLSAKQEFAATAAERDQLRRENDELRRQFDWMLAELQDVTEQFRKLKMAVLARRQAQTELVALHREREIQQAERAERDLGAPLN